MKHIYIFVYIVFFTKKRYARIAKAKDESMKIKKTHFLALFIAIFCIFTPKLSNASNIPFCIDKDCFNVNSSYPDYLAQKTAQYIASTTLTVSENKNSTTSTATTSPITTQGDMVISLLLSILIIINIFAGVHNAFFGVKVKKQKYD